MPKIREAMRVRMERLDILHLFTDTGKLNRLAGNRAHGKRRAASGIAVQLCEASTPVSSSCLVKGLGNVYRILAGHGVHHQQDLGGLNFTPCKRLELGCIISSSICRRPAVSTISISYMPFFRRFFRLFYRFSQGPYLPHVEHGIPACSPRVL